MRERTHLSDAIAAFRALERELDDAITLAELGEAGKTVLVTSHRMDELAGLLDEVWVMRMALSVLLMCWPPAPEARKVSTFRSLSRISMLMSSSITG